MKVILLTICNQLDTPAVCTYMEVVPLWLIVTRFGEDLHQIALLESQA